MWRDVLRWVDCLGKGGKVGVWVVGIVMWDSSGTGEGSSDKL